MGLPSIEAKTVSTDCFGAFNSPLLEYTMRRDTAMQMMRPLYFDRHLAMRELRAFGERLMSIPQVPCSFFQPVLPHDTALDRFLEQCILSVRVTTAAAHMGEAGMQIPQGQLRYDGGELSYLRPLREWQALALVAKPAMVGMLCRPSLVLSLINIDNVWLHQGVRCYCYVLLWQKTSSVALQQCHGD